ncbi:hypothetical protein DPMN_042423 [Dreissena polymorpha]|uniref:Uncharacterized protein n=1 Tax=Dreissena polymorpha TaxID=45954 RepID=A0A9D4HUR2_DREPO|nr:hypothetical protein DPMN_042423 [Dreissena polymorpha]
MYTISTTTHYVYQIDNYYCFAAVHLLQLLLLLPPSSSTLPPPTLAPTLDLSSRAARVFRKIGLLAQWITYKRRK